MDLASAVAGFRKAISAPRLDLLTDAFPEQRAYIEDRNPLKAAFCTRRAAKSYGVGLEYLNDAQEYPGAAYLLLMTSRAQAKRDFWHDVLKAIDAKHDLGCKFNESELVCYTPNGARIYVGGADANEKEWRKLVAGKYRKVQIDEAQGFIHMDLKTLVFETFQPAVMDYEGTIGLSGTPGIRNSGLFYDVVVKGAPGWSVHRWKTEANPHMREKQAKALAKMRLAQPGIELTPAYRRNYLAEWIREDSHAVYRYLEGRNDWTPEPLPIAGLKGLPLYKHGRWHFVLGCDLGYNDPTAWVVCAYHDHDPVLRIIETRKEPGLDITAVANVTREYRKKYDFDALVIDNANKQAVEEMRKRHSLPWVAADKTGKSDFIEIMNSEFITGRILLGPDADDLRTEYADLVWDPKYAKAEEEGKKPPPREEHPACENHCADAALYAWRYCYQFTAVAHDEPPTPGSPEEEDAWEAEDEENERRKEEEYA